jgi:hypothetical protein
MATYIHLSRVYLNDTELYELISPKNLPVRKLRSQMRERGLFYSERGREEDVRSRIAFLPSDWKLVSTALSEIAAPDPRERRTAQRITNYVPDQDIAAAVTKVQDERSTKYGEVYNQSVTPDGLTRIEVTYTELDYSRAVPYQRRQRKLSVEIAPVGETLNIRYDATEKAAKIVEGLKSALTYREKDAPQVQQITLRAIRDPALRTRFFTELIKGIDGFKYENATHIAVDRRLPNETDEGEGAGGDGDERATEDVAAKRKVEEQIRGLVNRVSLTGEQVLATELYEKAASSGYYIAAIHWTCTSRADSRVHIDCEAALVDPPEGEPFSFDFVRQSRNKEDDPDGIETEAVDRDQRRRYEDLIETAARNAFKIVTAAAEPTAAGVSGDTNSPKDSFGATSGTSSNAEQPAGGE